jgi:hypothetical protein
MNYLCVRVYIVLLTVCCAVLISIDESHVCVCVCVCCVRDH